MAAAELLAHAPRHRKVALGLIALAVAVAAVYAVLSPRAAQRAALTQRAHALAGEVRQAQREAATLSVVSAEARALRSRFEAAKHRLPAEPGMPALYRQISDLAGRSGLALALFAPKPAENKPGLAELAISVTAEGTYHQLAAFVSGVAASPRIVTVGDFRLVAIDRPTGTIRADLTLLTHLLRPESAVLPGAVSASRTLSPASVRPDAGRPAGGQ